MACTEAEARQIIGAEGAALLVEVVRGAWQTYLDDGRSHRRRTRANIVWEYMVGSAEPRLRASEGVKVVMLRNETPAFVLRDRLALRLKKHDRDLATRNVPTRTQVRMDAFGHLDGMPDLAHATCGYILDAAEASVDKVVVVRRVAGAVEWWIDLEELAGGQFGPGSPILPNFPNLPSDLRGAQAPLPIIVKPASEGEEEGR